MLCGVSCIQKMLSIWVNRKLFQMPWEMWNGFGVGLVFKQITVNIENYCRRTVMTESESLIFDHRQEVYQRYIGGPNLIDSHATNIASWMYIADNWNCIQTQVYRTKHKLTQTNLHVGTAKYSIFVRLPQPDQWCVWIT